MKSLFLVEKTITNPELFSILNNRVVIYDQYSSKFIDLTGNDDEHFVRHVQRVIASAANRFAQTVDKFGKRIPACDLPNGLFQARMCCENSQEAEMNALQNFCNAYSKNSAWPNCTMSLAPIESNIDYEHVL